MVIPALWCNPKVKTILHIHAPPLCHIQRQRLYKTSFFDSTLIPHDHVRVLRLKHIETQTENMDIIKHLEKNDSSNRHVGHLRKRALQGWSAALWSIYYKLKLHLPEPIIRWPEGWDGFHLVFSPSLKCKLKTLYPPRFYQFNIKSALAQHNPHQPLFTPLVIFLGTKWDSSSST